MKTFRNSTSFDLHVLTLDESSGAIDDDVNVPKGSGKIELKKTPDNFWIVVGCEEKYSFTFSIIKPLKIKRVVLDPNVVDSGNMPAGYKKVAYLLSVSASEEKSAGPVDEDMNVDDDNRVPAT